MKLIRLVLLVVGLLVLLSLGTSQVSGREPQEERPVSLNVYPKLVLAGMRTADVRVSWRIPRHKDNRMYSFVMQGENGDYDFVSGQLDGDSQLVFPTCRIDHSSPCYRTVRAGNYVFEACVYRKTNGKEVRLCADERIEVK